MTSKTELLDLESQLTYLKEKKSQLDSEAMRHELEVKSAKNSLETSLGELKDLGFSSIKEAETFLDSSVEELKNLLTEAQDKINNIVTE